MIFQGGGGGGPSIPPLDPMQTAKIQRPHNQIPAHRIAACRSWSTAFVCMPKLVIDVSIYMQQTTSADKIFISAFVFKKLKSHYSFPNRTHTFCFFDVIWRGWANNGPVWSFHPQIFFISIYLFNISLYLNTNE